MLLSLHEWLVAQKIEAGAFKNNLAVCFCVLLWSVTLKHKSTMRIKSASSCLHSEWTVVVPYVISFPFFSVMHKRICDFSSTFVEMAGTPGLFKLVKQTTLKLVVVFDCKANLIVAPDSPQPPLQDACGCRWGQQEAPGAVDSRASVELRGSYTESDGEPKPTPWLHAERSSAIQRQRLNVPSTDLTIAAIIKNCMLSPLKKMSTKLQ